MRRASSIQYNNTRNGDLTLKKHHYPPSSHRFSVAAIGSPSYNFHTISSFVPCVLVVQFRLIWLRYISGLEHFVVYYPSMYLLRGLLSAVQNKNV